MKKWGFDEWAILVVIVIAVGFLVGIITSNTVERNQWKADCAASAEAYGMETRWRDGCEMFTPEYGWMNQGKYITMVGTKTILEDK